MVSIVMIGFLMIVGLLSMAVVASVVSAARKALEPDRPESYYAGVSAVMLGVGVVLGVFGPPVTSAVGVLASFGGWFGLMLAFVYVGLAVYHARGMADGDNDGPGKGGEQAGQRGRDRPLSQR